MRDVHPSSSEPRPIGTETIRQQAEARQAAEGHIREVAGTSPVDELAKLNDLRRQGAISQEGFDRLKANIVA